MRRAIAKRHGFSCGDETALCGKQRVCSPGLVCDPSSQHMCASTARLVAAVQGLQGPGSRPVPLRVAHDPDRPTAVVRLTLCCETSLTWRFELRAAATTWLRRGRAFVCLECASRGWLGSIRRPEATCAADKGERRPMAVLTLLYFTLLYPHQNNNDRFSAVQIRDGRRLSRSGQEPRHWPLRLCQL